MSNTIEIRIRELGLAVPLPPPPQANYLPFVRVENLVQLSGVASIQNGGQAVFGKLGQSLSLGEGKKAAHICALNLLANLRIACGGDLGRVNRFLMLRGYVNASDNFEDVPLVMNGASDLIVDVFGAAVGKHARTSIGCSALPSGAAVEADALVLIDDDGLETDPAR